MFENRENAAHLLAEALMKRKLHFPVVLAIPRGGVVTGAVLARDLGADLDVVLSRKLRAPGQPEYAIGAISEDGKIYLNTQAMGLPDMKEGYLAEERQCQLGEIARRKKLFRAVLPQAHLEGRTVIVTDDGIATGSTMIAALQSIAAQKPLEIIVAIPVAPPDRIRETGRWCDEVICLYSPDDFWSVGQFYRNFEQVEDDDVIRILRDFSHRSPKGNFVESRKK